MAAALQGIWINTDLRIRRQQLSEHHDCVIVDDFLQDPHEVVEFAAHHAGEFTIPEKGNYPGLLYRVDGDLMTDTYRFIRSTMTKHFPFLRGDMSLWTFFSIATLQPDEMSHRQRICHTDPCSSPDRTCYAALLYLFANEDLGGTGFYRWKKSAATQELFAIEREDPARAPTYLQEHFPALGESSCYMSESNEIAELVCMIPPRFNRLVFYPGTIPHSAAITAPKLLSSDCRKGRLTLNVFADVRPSRAVRPSDHLMEA